MKLLSIVVPCYNSQDYMEKCIESLLRGGNRIEIIIVDDGSDDNTASIADGYAQNYPDIVKVIHQVNGGHGEAINVGLKNAGGRFFKVVDSDDKLSDDLPRFLDILQTSAYNADFVVNNYVYTYVDGSREHPIRFSNAFRADRIIGWNDVKRFKINQVLMIHCCTFRTDFAVRYGGNLPKHVFYEDNFYVAKMLPHTEKIYYCNLDLYYYTIGREGQSVAAEVITERYKHQMLICEMIFDSLHFEEIKQKSKRLYSILYQEMLILYGGACVYAMRSSDPQYYENISKMWEKACLHDEKYGKKISKSLIMRILSLKGNSGRKISVIIYNIARKIVRFN